MQLKRFSHAAAAAEWVAEHLADSIRSFSPTSRPSRPWWVMGLPTGETPIPIYRYWAEQHRQGRLSFRSVVTFNMDEYLGLSGEKPGSFFRFMQEHLFDKVDLPPAQRHLLDGAHPDPDAVCRDYALAWQRFGGVDIQLAGVGREGHLAFNEAWSSLSSTVRVVNLAPSTLKANVKSFERFHQPMPKKALTIGLKQILEARKLVVVALGPEKAEAVHRGVEGPLSHRCPLSIIQWHPNALLVCDALAASQLQPATLEALASEGDRHESF